MFPQSSSSYDIFSSAPTTLSQEDDAAIQENNKPSDQTKNNTLTNNITSPDDDIIKGIVYVHVGKTGGEWIKAQLRMICKTRRNRNIRAVCFQQKYPTHLSKMTVGYIHSSNMYIEDSSSDSKPRQTIPRTKSIQEVSSGFSHYLFSIRHPLRRLVSWYTYNHPKSCDEREPHSPSCKTSAWKKSFYNCFPTLQDLANHNTILIQPKDRNSIVDGQEDDCTKTFWSGWHGQGENMEPKDSNHLHWNYQFYWNETMVQTPEKKILAVRLESIEKDLMSLEGYLGRNPMAASKKIYWHPPDSFHFIRGGAPSQLDKIGTQRLCCLLLGETTVYRQILQQAINPLEKKEQSMQKIHESCQFSSWDDFHLECSNK